MSDGFDRWSDRVDAQKFTAIEGSTVISAEEADLFGEAAVVVVTTLGTLRLFHTNDCCESVELIDGESDLPAIVGGVVHEFRESYSDGDPLDGSDESYTWTLYTITTDKGDVTLRWFGSSNGYYGERIDAYWTPTPANTEAQP